MVNLPYSCAHQHYILKWSGITVHYTGMCNKLAYSFVNLILVLHILTFHTWVHYVLPPTSTPSLSTLYRIKTFCVNTEIWQSRPASLAKGYTHLFLLLGHSPTYWATQLFWFPTYTSFPISAAMWSGVLPSLLAAWDRIFPNLTSLIMNCKFHVFVYRVDRVA